MKILIEIEDSKFNYHSRYCPHCLTLYLFKLIRDDLNKLITKLRRDFHSDSLVIIDGTRLIDKFHMLDMEFRECDLHIRGSLYRRMVKICLDEACQFINPLNLIFPDEFDKIIVKSSIIEYYRAYMDSEVYHHYQSNFNSSL